MHERFIEGVSNQGLAVDSIIVTMGSEQHEHVFTNRSENNIRSISKTISCLAVYQAIETGLYDLDTCVYDYVDASKIHNKTNIDKLKNMKIRHLLNLTIGQAEGLMFSKDIKKLPEDTDLLYYILNYDIVYEPGKHFVYNNAATYLLCYITQKVTEMYFGEWVNKVLFKPMNIPPCKWESTNQGICLGASGLWMKNEDLHKIALLLLNDGIYEGNRIISEEWIKKMHTPHFYTADLPEYKAKQNRCINKMSYGYGLWICGDGSQKHPKTHYFCDGTDGQLLIVSPNDKMAITILSHQSNMNPLYELLRMYLK